MCDITEKEWNQKYLPFYHNFSKYMINYIIPDVVAFYIANGYSRNVYVIHRFIIILILQKMYLI